MRARLALVTATAAIAAAGVHPAAAEHAKPLTKTYTASATPDPAGLALSGQTCKGADSSRHVQKFTAPAPGYLKATLRGYDGDWDLSIENNAGQIVAESAHPDTSLESAAYTAKAGEALSVVACNLAGSPTATVSYTFAFVEPATPRGKSCLAVTDPAGDASLAPGGPSDDGLDILSVDVASDKKNLVGVLRLKKVPALADFLPYGRSYYVYVTPPDKAESYWLQGLFNSVGGVDWFYGVRNAFGARTTLDRADGTIDPVTNEIRMIVPVNKFGIVAGMRLEVEGQARQLFEFRGDDAAGGIYFAGAQSCVPAKI